VPPYLVVNTDNYTASPLAESFKKTVGKILVVMRQWLWERKRDETNNPNTRQMPTPVGVWWAFAKKYFQLLSNLICIYSAAKNDLFCIIVSPDILLIGSLFLTELPNIIEIFSLGQ
jgi:hypothetical protein